MRVFIEHGGKTWVAFNDPRSKSDAIQARPDSGKACAPRDHSPSPQMLHRLTEVHIDETNWCDVISQERVTSISSAIYPNWPRTTVTRHHNSLKKKNPDPAPSRNSIC